MAKSKLEIEKELQEAINKALLERANIQSRLNSGIEGYFESLKEIKKLNDTIKKNNELILEYQEKAKEVQDDATDQEKEAQRIAALTLDILKEENDELKIRQGLLIQSVKTAKVGQIAFTKLAASAIKGFAKLPDLVQNSFGQIKKLGLFEMDKAIRMSALQMGLLGKSTDTFRTDIKSAALDTLQIGMGIEELTKMQAEYSDNLGRNVMLNKSGLKAMSEMAVVTGLGADGTAKMAADLNNQGLSTERIQRMMQDTLDKTTKVGLNASKIFKNIASSTKMLNKYNFKDGVKGLTDMAKIVTKLGVGMEFAAGMTDKLFDIEGAVDMSAQLQVMGGAWAKLADPFKLMYMARNDMAGLTEELGKAAESAAHFNSKTGEFEISALEMHRLRKIAEQTGMSYEDLAQAGKNAAMFTKIKGQVSFEMDKDEKEFLTNTAKIDKHGKAYIEVNGAPKFLNQLTVADKGLLKTQITEKANMQERAKASLTFDDALTNTINIFKTALLPLIETMNTELLPKVQNLVDRFKKEKWGEQIAHFAEFIGGKISWLAGLMIDSPIITAMGYLSAKAMGWMFEKASWVLNGIALAQGFNLAAGGTGNALNKISGGAIGPGFKGRALKAGGYGLAAGAVGLGGNYLEGKAKESGNEDLGKGIGVATSAGSGALTGAAIGSLVPLIGTAVGAIVGGILGAGKGIYDEYYSDASKNGLIGSPIHDGVIGSDFSKGRGIIDSGRISPIDNKDELIAMKPNGPVAKAINQANSTPQIMKIDFGDIVFKGEIQLTNSNGQNVSVDIMKNPQFIRDITRAINVETSKVINGGKVKP